MSDNSLEKKPLTDLTDSDLNRIQKFMDDGMPGLGRLQETDVHRMTEMYMNGSTYIQIQSTLNLTRSLVLYMSYKYGWYAARQEYLSEMQEKIKTRIIESKLESQDFLLLMIQSLQKNIGKKLQKYLATDNPNYIDEIDLKKVDKLMKAMEIVQNLGDSKTRNPAVGLNLGEGVTIERSGDNKVTITPNVDKQLGNILKKFADDRRAEQNKNDKSDINKQDTKKGDET